MHVTYWRPDTFDYRQIDPEAPDADLDVSQMECEAVPRGIPGCQCTRPTGHPDDEHRAVFGQLGDGPPRLSRSRGPTSARGPEPTTPGRP